jgi:hypothetical protein
VRSLRYLQIHRNSVAQSIEDVRREAVHSRRALLRPSFTVATVCWQLGQRPWARCWTSLSRNGGPWTRVAPPYGRAWRRCFVAYARPFDARPSRFGMSQLVTSC